MRLPKLSLPKLSLPAEVRLLLTVLVLAVMCVGCGAAGVYLLAGLGWALIFLSAAFGFAMVTISRGAA